MERLELINILKNCEFKIDAYEGIDCVTVLVPKESLFSFLKLLKEDERLKFNMIADITAVDYPEQKPRFELVYHIFSIANNIRIRVKSRVEEGDSVESVTSLWKGAEWLEREVFDMFGINFKNHPDLRRILMTEDFKYYPLRKDFPLQGIEES
ncbi:MAG: NADH-quinone oxidoreductase subunit C [Proteobacteria bacterium]|nr:NADH-quinone oxidoreductase subunit C [Pseudomonadota bacterium]